MRLKLTSIAFAAACFIPLLAQASSAASCSVPFGPLNLSQAVDIALCANPLLRSYRLDAAAATAEVGRARASYLPTVTAAAGASLPKGASGPSNQQSIAVNWLLLDFGERKARVAAAQATLEASDAVAAGQAQDLALAVAQAYLQAQAALASVDSALAQERVALGALALAQARRETGDAIKLDVLQAQGAVAQAEVAKARAQGSLATQRSYLAMLLAIPAEEASKILLASAVPDDSYAHVPQEVSEMVVLAKDAREDLVAARARAVALEEQAKAARAAYFPTVAFGLSASRSDPAQGPATSTHSAGVTLHVPLYSGALPAQVRSLTAQAQAQHERVAAAQNRVGYDVVAAYETARSAGAQLVAAQALAAAAAEAQVLAQARYEAGVGTSLEVFDALARNSVADETLIAARLSMQLSRAQLARALGSMPVR